MSYRQINLCETLRSLWPETDLSSFSQQKQVELASKWLRQCCDWINSTHPGKGVMVELLEAELGYREIHK